MKRRFNWKRGLAIAMSTLMVLGSVNFNAFSLTAFAEETTPLDETVMEEVLSEEEMDDDQDAEEVTEAEEETEAPEVSEEQTEEETEEDTETTEEATEEAEDPEEILSEEEEEVEKAGIDLTEAVFKDAKFRQYLIDNFADTGDATPRISDTEDVKSLVIPSTYADEIKSLAGIEKLTSIQELECHAPLLTEISLKNNKALKRIDLSGCALTTITMPEAASKLMEIDLSGNALTKLKLQKYSNLETLNISDNKIATLEGLSNDTSFTTFDCSNNQFTELDLTNVPVLEELYCGGNKLKTLDVYKNIKLKVLDCSDNKILSEIIIEGAADETKPDEITVGPLSIRKLNISGCAFKYFDVSKLTKLSNYNCSHNYFEKLSLTSNTALEILDCSYNRLVGLDLSKNTKMYASGLTCDYNQIFYIDLNDAFGELPTTKIAHCKFVSDSNIIPFDTDKNRTYIGFKAEKIVSFEEDNLTKTTETVGTGKDKRDVDREFVILDGNKPAKFKYKANAHTVLDVTITVVGETYAIESIKIPQTLVIDVASEGNVINTEILPAEACGLAVTYESSNPSVVTVNDKGELTPLSAGTATIVVKSAADPTVVSNTCEVTVKGFVAAPMLDATVVTYSGVADKLKNVPLPEALREDYEWDKTEGELSLTSYKDSRAVFSAVRKESKKVDGITYEEVPVTVWFVSVKDVQLMVNNSTLYLGESSPIKTTTVYAVPIVSISPDSFDYASNKNLMDYTIEYKFTDVSKANSIDIKNASDKVPYRIVSVGDNTKKGTATIEAQIIVKCGGITCVNKTKKINIKVDELLSSGDINVMSMTKGGAAYNPETDDLVVGDEVIVKVEANGIPASKKVKLTSGNKNVIKVTEIDKTLTYSTYKLSVVGYGVSVLTYSAVKNTKVKTQEIINVRDYAPALISTTVSVNKLLKDKSANVTLLESFETAYTDLKVEAVKEVAKASASDFTFAGNTLTVAGKVPKGTYNLTVSANVGGNYLPVGTLKVSVVEKKPSLVVKQTKKVNIFYKPTASEQAGALEVYDKNRPGSPVKVTIKDSDFTYNEATGSIITTAGKDYKELKKTATLSVEFEDYESGYAHIDKNMTISTVNTAPKITAEAANKLISTKLKMKSTDLVINVGEFALSKEADVFFVKDGKNTLAIKNNKLVKDEGTGIWSVVYNDEVEKGNGELSGGTFTLSVKEPGWNEAIKTNLTLNVTDEIPSVKAEDGTQLTLNQKIFQYDEAETSLAIKQAGEFEVYRAYITPDVDAAKIQDVVTVYYDAVAQSVKAKFSVNTFGPGYKPEQYNGTYTYKLTPVIGTVIDGKLTVMKGNEITIKVKVINQTPKVSIKTKGTIDLMNRAETGVELTPTFTYVNGDIKGAALAGANRNMFKLEKTGDKYTIRVRDDVSYKSGNKYAVKVAYTLKNNRDNIVVKSEDISIVLKQNAVKIKVNNGTVVTSARGKNVVLDPVTFNCSKGSLDHTQFHIVSDPTGQFSIAGINRVDSQNVEIRLNVNNGSNLVAGKTYPVKVAVTFTDAGANTQDTIVTVKVKVVK